MSEPETLEVPRGVPCIIIPPVALTTEGMVRVRAALDEALANGKPMVTGEPGWRVERLDGALDQYIAKLDELITIMLRNERDRE